MLVSACGGGAALVVTTGAGGIGGADWGGGREGAMTGVGGAEAGAGGGAGTNGVTDTAWERRIKRNILVVRTYRDSTKPDHNGNADLLSLWWTCKKETHTVQVRWAPSWTESLTTRTDNRACEGWPSSKHWNRQHHVRTRDDRRGARPTACVRT